MLVSTVNYLTVPDDACCFGESSYEEGSSHEKRNDVDRTRSRHQCRRGRFSHAGTVALVSSVPQAVIVVNSCDVA
jgi:hypothetical protein